MDEVFPQRRLLRLSWPSKALFQNARVHWAVRKDATKAYRQEAYTTAILQTMRGERWANARLVFSFHPPDRRHRDCHNMPEAMKAAIDGIADAVGGDDHGFRCEFPTQLSEPTKGGCVMIEVWE